MGAIQSRNWLRNIKRRQGFTIVELVIVVFVIGILATIVTAAYNGITARARNALLLDTASSASRRIGVYQIEHGGAYPDSILNLDGKPLPTANGVDYQYSVDNGVTPKSYCLTVTSPGVETSYYISSLVGTPTSGLCPGHVLNPVIPINSLETPPNTSNITIAAIQPNQTINTAYSAFLNIYTSATGSPTPSVQWQRLDPKNTDLGAWVDISGQTAAQLNWIYNAAGYQEGDYGYFRVKYTNSSGTATSPVIKVTFYYESD